MFSWVSPVGERLLSWWQYCLFHILVLSYSALQGFATPVLLLSALALHLRLNGRNH
jgi:hypothetical protein